jgi:hypothetical protein
MTRLYTTIFLSLVLMALTLNAQTATLINSHLQVVVGHAPQGCSLEGSKFRIAKKSIVGESIVFVVVFQCEGNTKLFGGLVPSDQPSTTAKLLELHYLRKETIKDGTRYYYRNAGGREESEIFWKKK